MPKPKTYMDILNHDKHHREDDEQITVWEPDVENRVMVWFENEDGECSFQLHTDERRKLAEHLLRGL